MMSWEKHILLLVAVAELPLYLDYAVVRGLFPLHLLAWRDKQR